VDALKKSKKIRFLARWIGVNLVGWIAGVFSGLCLGEFYLAPIFSLSFDSSLTDALAPLFVWLPHGVWVGIMQLEMMKKWKIQPIIWVIATSLGWGIPATLLAWYHENMFVKQFGYGISYEYGLYSFLGIVLVGASVGSAQSLVMGSSFAKRGLWILANVLGLVICVLVAASAMFLVMSLLPPESSFDAYNFGFLTWVVLLLSLSLAGIIPSLATGLYLLKYSINRFDNEGINPISNTLLNSQAG
jgi:hypothetical protein